MAKNDVLIIGGLVAAAWFLTRNNQQDSGGGFFGGSSGGFLGGTDLGGSLGRILGANASAGTDEDLGTVVDSGFNLNPGVTMTGPEASGVGLAAALSNFFGPQFTIPEDLSPGIHVADGLTADAFVTLARAVESANPGVTLSTTETQTILANIKGQLAEINALPDHLQAAALSKFRQDRTADLLANPNNNLTTAQQEFVASRPRPTLVDRRPLVSGVQQVFPTGPLHGGSVPQQPMGVDRDVSSVSDSISGGNFSGGGNFGADNFMDDPDRDFGAEIGSQFEFDD